MAAKGNDFWKLADWGKPKAYQPIELWDMFREYVDSTQNSKWYKNEAIKGGDSAGSIVSVPTERPFTIQGFCVFAEIASSTFYLYEKEAAYSEIVLRIRDVIFAQKFEGAAVGAFNANIIARDLGLKEQTDITTQGEKISPVITAMIDGQIIDGEMK